MFLEADPASPSTHRPSPYAGLWRREGRIFSPPALHGWWESHAQVPTVLPLGDRLWRVFFAARDNKPSSRVLCVDIDPGDGFRAIRLHPDPVLSPGSVGAFDHDGVIPSTALAVDGRVYLYYIGVHRRLDVPFQLGIGLAVSYDGLGFRRLCAGPVLSTGPRDPFSSTAPCVRQTAKGFEMWYSSFVDWRSVDGAIEPFCSLRRAYSEDGVIWRLDNELTLDLEDLPAASLARPWVVGDGAGLRLWFSSRGASRFRGPGETAYRLYSATLPYGDGWTPEELKFENPPGPDDWDSWMQAYGCVIPLGEDLIMIYNGNGFGRNGFGYARLPGGRK
jgi:hypothetical protein